MSAKLQSPSTHTPPEKIADELVSEIEPQQATSTGGTSARPAGRVGDVPLPGSGFWTQGGLAVASTGVGEAITKSLLSYRVYRRIRSTGDSLDTAMQWGIDELIDEGVSVGLISLGSEGEGRGHSNTDMPWAAWTG